MSAKTRSVACLCLTLVAFGCSSEPGPAPHNDEITAEALSEDLHALSDDSLKGRLVGTPEIELAAEWIAERFESLGLEPAGTDGYFSPFEMVWPSLGQPNAMRLGSTSHAMGDGWYPLIPSGTGSAEGDVVFAGFGIVEPRIGYDDYKGADVGGKVVLVLEREPGAADSTSAFDGIVTTEGSAAWRKALTAQKKGAVALLFVRDVHNRPEVDGFRAVATGYWPRAPRRIERFTLKTWVDQITIPVAQISAEVAKTLVAGSGRTLEELAAASETPSGLGVVELPGAHVGLTTTVTRNVTPARNVLAKVEGSDGSLADEVVIISAHHDHNGADTVEVFNGADDDGSGIVGVLAVAAAYARAAEDGDRPKRTVVFAAWDAEERGLLGAWQYTEKPSFPLERTAGVLNLDMIGRNEEVPESGGRFNGLPVQTAAENANAVNILGYTRSPELSALVSDANADYGLELKLRYDNNGSNLLRRSDHWPFLQRGVPAVWFHTGLHPDYHTGADDADRIEYDKMEKIVRLVHQSSWDLANQTTRPAMGAAMGPVRTGSP